MENVIIFDWVDTLAERGTQKPFDFSEKVLKTLKARGYKLCLVSLAGKGIEKRKQDIEQSGLQDYFESIKVDLVKEPRHYLSCISEMQSTIENTSIVDDHIIRGIKIGNKLGCKTYWIQVGTHSTKLPNEETGEPTARINSVEDLLNVFKTIKQ